MAGLAMTREDIIRMALEAGFGCDTDGHIFTDNHDGVCDEYLERFGALVAAAEREAWPRLDPVIAWLENGCDPAEAAKELRIYAAAIRARGDQ